MGKLNTASAFCGDNRHSLCNGNTQDAAGQWTACGCPAPDCLCLILARREGRAERAAS